MDQRLHRRSTGPPEPRGQIGGLMINALLFWLILLAVFYFAYTLGARSAAARYAAAREAPPVIPTEALAAMESRVAPMLAITGRKVVGEVFQFEGRLRGKAEETFRKIREVFTAEPFTPMLLEGEHNDVRVVVLPGRLADPAVERTNWGLHGLLFLATLATTTWAGALHAGVNLLQQPERFAVGLPYSLGLLLILGAHELGHYFTAKAHGIRVTPPYFIPVPFALGTFGAFIKIKSLTPDRRALFDVAVAGPLAGLVFAIPALLIGLRFSQVIPNYLQPPTGYAGVNIGSSVLLACLAKMSLGASVLEGNHLLLHPLAFAGWLGLIVTALNLLPIGQLDGGHISHALFGSRNAHALSTVALAGLFLLALFVWPGLMFWAFIVFFVAGTHDAPAANDISPVGFPRQALGYFTLLLLLLIIVPVPHSLYEVISVHGPYL
jgi:membrane-associated protease RseP (regulator of RpoE activity)